MESRRVLSDNEEIRYQTRKHWAVFIKAAIYFGLALLILSGKDPILRHVPYTSLYEAAQGSQLQATQPSHDQKISPQTQDDIKRLLVPTVTWTVTGACFLLVVALGLLGLARLLGFFSNKVIITSKRVIQHDVLSGSLSSLSLPGVESARAATGLLGSILGYGKVILIMGSGQKISIANLRRPLEFERELFGAK